MVIKKRYLLLILLVITVSSCVNQAEEDILIEDEEVISDEPQVQTCEEQGGKCADPLIGRCSRIDFELGRPVSDCPGNCCVCCKQIIPECVPDQCCHARGCTLEQLGPDCSGVVCTQDCIDGTMDCGKGKCEFDYDYTANNHCKLVYAK